MRRSRRRADDTRTGRRDASRASSDSMPSGLSAAADYELLLPKLARLRAVLATEATGARSIVDVRRDHVDLDHSLADAVAQAFAADAVGASPPHGMSSWVAEGLARSQEREQALFAAADVSGVLQATTAPSPRWGSTDATEARPSSHARLDAPGRSVTMTRPTLDRDLLGSRVPPGLAAPPEPMARPQVPARLAARRGAGTSRAATVPAPEVPAIASDDRERAVAPDEQRIATALADTVIRDLFGLGLALHGTLPHVTGPGQQSLNAAIDGIDHVIRTIRDVVFVRAPSTPSSRRTSGAGHSRDHPVQADRGLDARP